MENLKTQAVVINYKGFRDQIVTIEDMPNQDMVDIAEVCGIEAAVKLLSRFGGLRINIPANGLHKIDKKIILNEYDGYAQTIKRLTAKLGLTEKTVRTVLQDYKTILPEDGQLNMFPEGWCKLVKKDLSNNG